MRRLPVLLFVLLALTAAGLFGARWLRPAGAPPATAPAQDPPQPVVAASPPQRAATPTPAHDTAESTGAQQESTALIRSDPVLQDRARQHELASAADARWEQAVDEGGYSATDLDPAVRNLFERIDLEPRYAAEGRIEGLVIRGVAPDHPLALAGFRAGDLIESIQGTPLADPADLPSLLAHLGPNVALCARREDGSLCRELDLE